MKELNEIYNELKAEADNEDCDQSLWAMAEKIYKEQTFNTYGELMEYIDNNDDVEYMLDYDDFAVVEIINDIGLHEYWYFEQGEDDCDTFCKVEIMAELTYDVNNDLQTKDETILHTLFDCYCCGEQVNDNDIKYLWFKAVI